jgi:hypothetical protein
MNAPLSPLLLPTPPDAFEEVIVLLGSRWCLLSLGVLGGIDR